MPSISEARVPEVDLLSDACHPLGRLRDLVETVGDDRGPQRIDGAILNRADRAGRPRPAAGYIWLPAYRCEARRAARGRLALLGDPLQVHLGLRRIVRDHLKKTLPQRVLRLQTEEEMHVLEVGIDLLQAAQNAMVRRVGVLGAGQVAGVVEQVACAPDRVA